MAGRGDQTMKTAVLAALQKGPRDVLDLLEVLRVKAERLLHRHEGLLHPLLHAMVRRGEIALAPLSERGLSSYRRPDDGAAAEDAVCVPDPLDVSSPTVRSAERIASGIRQVDDRVRVAADVAAHLEALEAAGHVGDFGSKRTVRHYLRRADRRRPSVFFAADGADGFRRFALHEGPWILGAVVIFLVVRAFIAEVFVIPSGSMIPTLLPGDRVVVHKPGGKAMPDRWTITTFERRGTTYVKRAVGLGGERITLVGGDVYIDGVLEVKPEDLRAAFRTPYGAWDFIQDGPLWKQTTESETGRVTWTYDGAEAPLWSVAPQDAVVTSGAPRWDVRLRDVYATLEVDLAEGDTVEFDLVYDRPVDRVAGEAEFVRLAVSTTSAGLIGSARLTSNPWNGAPIVAAPLPTAGPVALHLSHVDGVVRAQVGGSRWELPVRVTPGYVVTPRVRVSKPTTRPVRLLLDKDLHYSRHGDQGHPPDGSDDDPTTYGFRIPDGHVFFLGDNTSNSRDSRYRRDDATGHLGPIAVEELIGPVTFRIWPPGRIGGVR